MSTTVQSDVITVSTYADRLNAALSRAGGAVVEGEVQDVRRMRAGVVSFTLTDGVAKLPCRYLPWLARGRGLTHTPATGDQVRVAVRHAEWYREGGTANIVISDVQLAGEGELLRRRAELIATLTAEGLCDSSQFPALPRFPRGVGLIAGVNSDAYHDVIQGLRDRFPAVLVLTYCCRVQGAGAAQEIIAALAALSDHPLVDVIVIARGGGSVQDLAVFDHEGLCRAIRAIDTPVITAIGHTQNNPVCNHITHAAFVPRHAAELVVVDRAELLAEVDGAAQAMNRAIRELRRATAEFELAAGTLSGARRLQALRAELLAAGNVIARRAGNYLNDGDELLSGARGAFTRASANARAVAAEARRAVELAAAVASIAAKQPAHTRATLERDAAELRRAGARTLASHRENLTRALDRLAANATQAAARLLATRRMVITSESPPRGAGERHLRAGRAALDAETRTVQLAAVRVLAARRQNLTRALDRLAATTAQAAARRLADARADVHRDAGQLHAAGRLARERERRELAVLIAVLDACDFRRRGWLLATGATGRAIASVRDIATGDLVYLHLQGGDADAVINATHPTRRET